MKPAPFDYVAPRSLAEALEILATRTDEAKILAGGQSLIPVLNFRLAQPALLVDINGLAELDFVRAEADGGLTIGALVRQRRLERDPLVAERAPLLAEAVPFIAHPQIRNRGTIGGSLAHADPAAELPAVAVALGARLRLQRPGGERWVEAARLLHRPVRDRARARRDPDRGRACRRSPPRTGWAFLEVARRHGDYAQVGVAARVTLDDAGRCREARSSTWRSATGRSRRRRAAAALVGSALDESAIARRRATRRRATRSIRSATSTLRPISSVTWRGVLTGRAVRRRAASDGARAA